MTGITVVAGRGIPLAGDNIDTDRIIPARHLKEITFENMGRYFFQDERFGPQGQKSHVLNDARFSGGSILIVNKNFGCGSSREHAAHAVKKFGINAIIGESFSPIFEGNCLSLGIPVVCVSEGDAKSLMAGVGDAPEKEIEIHLDEKNIRFGGRAINFMMPEQNRKALANGSWNSTEVLMANAGLVKEVAGRLPYLRNFEDSL